MTTEEGWQKNTLKSHILHLAHKDIIYISNDRAFRSFKVENKNLLLQGCGQVVKLEGLPDLLHRLAYFREFLLSTSNQLLEILGIGLVTNKQSIFRDFFQRF